MRFLWVASSSLFTVEQTSKNHKEGSKKKSLSRLGLQPEAITALLNIQKNGYRLILVIEKNLLEKSEKLKSEMEFLLDILSREGVIWEKIFTQEKFKDEFLDNFQEIRKMREWESYLIMHRQSLSIGNEFQKNLGVNQIIFDEQFQKNVQKQSYFNSWKKLSDSLIGRDRVYQVDRKTNETHIEVKINLDGTGKGKIDTGLKFFDHMLDNFSKHSKVDLFVRVKGDLEVDEHHTIEDTAIVLAEAFKQAWSDKRGIARYGFVLPMDESETACSLDLSGRGHLEWQDQLKREYVGDFPTELLQHFYYSFCINAGVNMNMKITGKNDHHQIESSFKAWAQCIKQAVKREGNDLPSTKGLL